MVSECPLIALAKNMPRDNPQAHRATVTALGEVCEHYGLQPGMPVVQIEAHLAQLEVDYYNDASDEPSAELDYSDDHAGDGPDFTWDR